MNNANVGIAAFPNLALLEFHGKKILIFPTASGETESGPIGHNLLRRHDLLGRTGKAVLEFSGPVGDMNLDGFEATILHAQAELFVDFFDAVLLEAIAHIPASGRDRRIAM